MPYLEHTRVLHIDEVVCQDVNADGTVDDYTNGTVSVLEHRVVVLDDDATEVIRRDYDGLTLRFHVYFDADGPLTTEVRLAPEQARTLKALLAKVEVPA